METMAPYTGYVYPNETIIAWNILIVVYPYLTGLVAGAFTVSSFYHVFGMPRFKPVARLALLTSLACMMFVPSPLLLHLGHPERALNSMLTPHFTSAFAMFGLFMSFYLGILVLECWFAFRVDNVANGKTSEGIRGSLYRAITLWSDDVSAKALAYDRKWLQTLAIIGVPAAHGLHLYVGFVYGSLKAREWWASDIMPVIFLFSAIVSGLALVMVIYVVVSRFRGTPVDEPCLKGMTYALWGFLMFTLLLEGLEFATLVYKGKEGIDMIMEYITGPVMRYKYFVAQFGLGSIVPIALLGVMIARGTSGRPFVIGATLSALLVLMGVFLMRWNVVIGGQEIAKSLQGLLTYEPELWGQHGALAALGVILAPFVLLWVFTRVVSPWEGPPGQTRS
jgi:Ni/Fe-hydrogenase subunit HybB-like protein